MADVVEEMRTVIRSLYEEGLRAIRSTYERGHEQNRREFIEDRVKDLIRLYESTRSVEMTDATRDTTVGLLHSVQLLRDEYRKGGLETISPALPVLMGKYR